MSQGTQEEFREGEKVKYHPTGAGNVSEGEIKRIITEPEAVGGRQTVKASEEEPRYVRLIQPTDLMATNYSFT
jgi:hypothetical protein